MKNHLSKLSLVLIGFVGGVAFLISCGGGDSANTVLPDIPINDADAGALPVINDQMYCVSGISPNLIVDETYIFNQASSPYAVECMKQSTKVKQQFNNLAEIYAEGWIMVEMGGAAAFLFYK